MRLPLQRKKSKQICITAIQLCVLLYSHCDQKSDREWQKNHSNLRNRGCRSPRLRHSAVSARPEMSAEQCERHSGRAAGKVSVRWGHRKRIVGGGHGETEDGRGSVFFVNCDSPFLSLSCSIPPTRASQTDPIGPQSEPNMGLRGCRRELGRSWHRRGRFG